MDPPASHRSRVSTDSKKHSQVDCDSRCTKSLPKCLDEDKAANHTPNRVESPCNKGAKNRLKDVYDSLITSKELLKVTSRVCRVDQQSSTTVSLFSALKLELDQACANIGKLIVERSSNQSDVEILLKHFEKAKAVWKLKEQDRICSAVKSVTGELETEKKLRRQTEQLNKKLGRELAETKAALSKTKKELENETRTREILEQVCDELARGIGDDRAEVEQLMRQFQEVREEVEKEREMLQVADVLREERMHMKLSEAKYQFEEKHALVDKLRYELESYLKLKRGDDDQQLYSPQYDKIKELQTYLRETLPDAFNQYHKNEEIGPVNEDSNDVDGEDLAETDLHSIVLNMDDTGKGFPWIDASNGLNRNSSNRTNGRRSTSITRKPLTSLGTNYSNGVEWEFNSDGQENGDGYDSRRTLAFGSSKKDVEEDEIERYNMIKDLRDHIVLGPRTGLSEELDSPGEVFGQPSVVASKDSNEVTCPG